MQSKKTILTGGENYITIPETKKTRPGEDRRPSYEEVKGKIIKNIDTINESVKKIPTEFIMEEVVLNLKMRVDRSSKSYHPSKLLRDCNINQVGTRKWEQKVLKNRNGNIKEETKIGKDIYVSLSLEKLESLKNIIANDELSNNNKDTLRSIEEFYIDTHENMLRGFSENWNEGRVEIVLHPIKGLEEKSIEELKKMIEKYNGDTRTMKVRVYENGPIFISNTLNINTLNEIKKFNVIRSIQPLKFRDYSYELDMENFIDNEKNGEEKYSIETSICPDVKLGIFDGGVTSNHYIFDKFVNEYNLTKEPKDEDGINHGNAVISSALFGDLKLLGKSLTLPNPTVGIESFRVLPLEDKNDYLDMYEVIDHIENIVPVRKDIKVYNLSIGPEGPIEDDTISRFTYSLDRLARNGDVIFCIAVGNSGESKDGAGRIQVPADSVNNISVGSYTLKENKKVWAEYSSYGDGREGAKIKPDIVDYGGDDENRIHFLASSPGMKMYGSGTSFSSPMVARKVAEILGYTSIKSPLTTKALLINRAEGNNKPNKYIGNGVVLDTYNDIMECTNNRVTITFEGDLLKSKRVEINIPFIQDLKFDGNVSFKWTLCIATSTNSKETDDYTDLCIEDTFIPNIDKYNYRYPLNNKQKKLDREKNKDEIKNLLDLGWIESKSPVTHQTTRYNYKTEQERRKNFKWDTVVNRFSGKISYQDIKSPKMILHAMSRDREDTNDRVKYSLVVSIEYIKCSEDVYSKTQSKYSLLNKSKVNNIAHIRM